MLRPFLLLTLLFFLALALACASISEPRPNPADDLSCEALMSVFADELRDQLLIQACAQEQAQECIGFGKECIQDKVYFCLEVYFEAKMKQVESLRARKCYNTLDSEESSM